MWYSWKAEKPFVFTAGSCSEAGVTRLEYKGLEVPKAELQVSEEDLQQSWKKEQEANSRIVEGSGRAVENSDTVKLDFEGFVDGEAFAGRKGDDYRW